MSMSKGYPHNIGGTVFAVVSGRGGNCLVLGDENGGTRISGPKPWGGGRTIMEFVTDEEYGPTEVLESENERLRELLKDVISHVNNPPCEGCMAEMNCCAGLEDVSQCDEWLMYVANAQELGIEVPQ